MQQRELPLVFGVWLERFIKMSRLAFPTAILANAPWAWKLAKFPNSLSRHTVSLFSISTWKISSPSKSNINSFDWSGDRENSAWMITWSSEKTRKGIRVGTRRESWRRTQDVRHTHVGRGSGKRGPSGKEEWWRVGMSGKMRPGWRTFVFNRAGSGQAKVQCRECGLRKWGLKN